MLEVTSKITAHKLFLDHVIRMTDNIGMLEHCISTVPDKIHGYSIDDNARALQLMLKILPQFPEGEHLIYQYLQFIISARDPKGFHNDLNVNMTWDDKPAVGEWYGRSMAALGDASASNVNGFPVSAAFVFDEMAPLIGRAESLRTKAQIMQGFISRSQFASSNKEYQVLLSQRKQLAVKKGEIFLKNVESEPVVKVFADELVEAYRGHKDGRWLWFEDSLIYDNARLPLALFSAYEFLDEKEYLQIAKDSLRFLIESTYDDKNNCFSFPGCYGWFPKHGVKALYGQQPIEAGSTVEVCALAYSITNDSLFSEMARKAFAWYSGRNIRGLSLIDEESQGIYDGLEQDGVNPNQGAESILSYLLAKDSLSQLK